ncbi:MAG TPA: shikimate kinase [Lachnospiraceae bacterium]|nr:shikimate kinase [Lachnospiraceae bacterium]
MKKFKNIVLIGFMGSGKSTVGRRLSMLLKRELIDTDDFIEKREGMKISEIFEEKGEPYFRQIESELCKRFNAPASKIIATGGGVIRNDENMRALKEGGCVVYLCATPEAILKNLQYDNTRPLLAGENKQERVRELMEQRRPFYEKYADITIDVSEREIEETISEIRKKVI